jgi:uncharacterized protein (TIGR02217 family)
MIYTDLIFPECISYGSKGGPTYQTDKVEVYSGAEQRQQRWAFPKHEYSIKMENLPPAEISEIMNIWHVCSGDFASFLFLDPMDHTSSFDEEGFTNTEVTATDQAVSTATGGRSSYELSKFYSWESRTKRRYIKYPKLDTLAVAVDGYPITSWTYSYVTGLLTFNAAVNTSATISCTSGVFDGFTDGQLAVGDLVYLYDLSNGSLNRPKGGNPLRVTAASGTTVTFQEFNGLPYAAATTFAGEAATYETALPPAGSVITAGFWFYTPVRFDDGDNMEGAIKAGLRESAFADFDSIKLREVLE